MAHVMRDAQVTTNEKDFLAPTNAGTSGVHTAPGVHGCEGVHPITPGAVSATAATQEAAELAHMRAYQAGLSLAVGDDTVSVAVAATSQIAATVTWADGGTSTVTSSCTYESSDDEKATVSSGGLITGVAAGSATVTVSYTTDSGAVLTAEVEVTVTSE